MLCDGLLVLAGYFLAPWGEAVVVILASSTSASGILYLLTYRVQTGEGSTRLSAPVGPAPGLLRGVTLLIAVVIGLPLGPDHRTHRTGREPGLTMLSNAERALPTLGLLTIFLPS